MEDQVKGLFERNPDLRKSKVFHPIMKNGDEDGNMYFDNGVKKLDHLGRLRYAGTNQFVTNKKSFIKNHDEDKSFSEILAYFKERKKASKERKSSNDSGVDYFMDARSDATATTASFGPKKMRAPSDTSMEGEGVRRRLTGRGLRGRGSQVHHNLLKDWLYKPLGDKYVHLKSLASNALVLKYPSGVSYARKLPISKAVTSLIRDMVLEGKKFDYDQYDQLTNNDQKVIFDLMQVTKAYRLLSKQLSDPYENDLSAKYQAELDKLIGELQLGNRNKKNIDELINLSSYLFKHGAIDQSKFKQYLSMAI
ncbi:Aste57867_15261 [Aphanomyces stellatus]|uniref:Aste57867_15261 protein n=1 Tax=Aphanomyces stellatus TaxID=120398 RepID=A0A485L5L9_9STRA|nr:hypothetical protein As57867_015205 [Aphanomyces stellatus]VFT92070.1 Aste57867_15261 [Aphanomyces stellatus]